MPPVTFPVEESLAAAGANDLRVFFVNRLGVFPQNHLVLEALPACLAQIRLVNSRMVNLKEKTNSAGFVLLDELNTLHIKYRLGRYLQGR